MEHFEAPGLLTEPSCSDTRVSSILNGQKRHCPLLSYARKTPIDAGVCVQLHNYILNQKLTIVARIGDIITY